MYAIVLILPSAWSPLKQCLSASILSHSGEAIGAPFRLLTLPSLFLPYHLPCLLQLAPWFVPSATSGLCSSVTFSEGLPWLSHLNLKSFPVSALAPLLPLFALFLSQALVLGVPHWPWGYLLPLLPPFLCPRRLSSVHYTDWALSLPGFQLSWAIGGTAGHWRERGVRSLGAYSLSNYPTGPRTGKTAFFSRGRTPCWVSCYSSHSCCSPFWALGHCFLPWGRQLPTACMPEGSHHPLLVSLKPWLALNKQLFINLSSMTYFECAARGFPGHYPYLYW